MGEDTAVQSQGRQPRRQPAAGEQATLLRLRGPTVESSPPPSTIHRPPPHCTPCPCLQSGAVLGRVWQPHESHISYLLQLKLDFNLAGMAWMRLDQGRLRCALALLCLASPLGKQGVHAVHACGGTVCGRAARLQRHRASALVSQLTFSFVQFPPPAVFLLCPACPQATSTHHIQPPAPRLGRAAAAGRA